MKEIKKRVPRADGSGYEIRPRATVWIDEEYVPNSSVKEEEH